MNQALKDLIKNNLASGDIKAIAELAGCHYTSVINFLGGKVKRSSKIEKAVKEVAKNSIAEQIESLSANISAQQSHKKQLEVILNMIDK